MGRTRKHQSRMTIDQFPALKSDEYEKTSDNTIQYNCIAWAADDIQNWWEPDPIGIWYWPPDAPREWTINGLIATFGMLGYEKCDNSDLEQGFEKIAVYATMSGKPTHAAWQRKDGRWSSKLGDGIDITHSTLNGISGTEYGTAMIFLKRLRQKRRND